MKRVLVFLLFFVLMLSVCNALAEGNMVKINTGSNPNVRSLPSKDGDLLGIAKSEHIYEILDTSENGWYKIILEDGTIGWIAGGMAKVVSSTSSNASQTNTITSRNETVPATITFSLNSGYRVTLDWTETPYHLLTDPQNYCSKSRMLFWSDPTNYTDNFSGYVVAIDSLSDVCDIKGVNAVILYLFYTFEFDEAGYSEDLSKAQLYMGEFYLGEQMEDALFKTLVNQLTANYGKPKTTETSTSESLVYNFRPMTITTYYRHYHWKCGENTGIHLVEEHGSQSSKHENVKLFIGKTNMDSTLRLGKLSDEAAYLQASVVAESISLKDSTGKNISTIKSGTTLTITGYDPTSNLFSVQFSESKAGKQYSGDSLYIYATTEDQEGYINGHGLDISKDELCEHFQ